MITKPDISLKSMVYVNSFALTLRYVICKEEFSYLGFIYREDHCFDSWNVSERLGRQGFYSGSAIARQKTFTPHIYIYIYVKW
jgi:hypothetical protein